MIDLSTIVLGFGERVEDRNLTAFKIASIACYQCELMHLNCCCNEHICLSTGLALGSQATSQVTRILSNLSGDGKNSAVINQESLEPGLDSRVGL